MERRCYLKLTEPAGTKKLQFRRGWEELEHFADFTWEVPSVTVLIITGPITVAGKVILSEASREEFLRELEENFRNNDLKIKPIPVETPEIKNI